MNKAEFVAIMAEKMESSKKDAEKGLNAFWEALEEALISGDKVQFVGEGSFEVKERAPREGMNPQTKEKITIPASKTVVFKVGKALKDKVNAGKK